MSKVDLVVLGFLNRQPMHGYEIIRFFEKRGIELWTRVKTPTVYKALQRMEKQGYIKGEFKQKGNNPPRKVFTITKAGKEYFMTTLRSFLWGKVKNHTPFDFWNALRFIHKNITREEFIRALDNHSKKLNAATERMEEKRKLAEECGKMENFPFYANYMHEMMQKTKAIEFDTIAELKAAAMLPENQKDFAEE